MLWCKRWSWVFMGNIFHRPSLDIKGHFHFSDWDFFSIHGSRADRIYTCIPSYFSNWLVLLYFEWVVDEQRLFLLWTIDAHNEVVWPPLVHASSYDGFLYWLLTPDYFFTTRRGMVRRHENSIVSLWPLMSNRWRNVAIDDFSDALVSCRNDNVSVCRSPSLRWLRVQSDGSCPAWWY